MYMENKEIFLERIGERLKSKNWSLNYLANQAGLSSGMIYKWYTTTSQPTMDSMEKVASALEVPVEYLIADRVGNVLDERLKLLLSYASGLNSEQLCAVTEMVRVMRIGGK